MKNLDFKNISLEILKDMKLLTINLKSSFEYQKAFIKGLFKTLIKYLNTPQKNKISIDFKLLIKELLITLKELVINLRIPFVYQLLNSTEDLLKIFIVTVLRSHTEAFAPLHSAMYALL